jgi:hypothetical protein
MSTPTTDIGEILARVEYGMAGSREAKVMKEYIEDLTWGPVMMAGNNVVGEKCRHCGLLRPHGHTDWCPAQRVK